MTESEAMQFLVAKVLTTNLSGFAHMDNNELLALWTTWEEQERNYRYCREQIEFELRNRMIADGATAIFHDHLTCELKTPSPTYDYGKLRRLAELVPPEELAKAFTPMHQEIVTVPDKWNAVKFKPWAKYGAEVAQVIADAMIPGTPRLSIKRKEILNKVWNGGAATDALAIRHETHPRS